MWGKPRAGCRASVFRPVHPHACGENYSSKKGAAGMERSTPTRVGKTQIFWFFQPFNTVHPHACGENGSIAHPVPLILGPPPRVWGKHEQPGVRRVARRSTPTRVGKTQVSSMYCQYGFGPPPRVWGKPARHPDCQPGQRSTPTRVGKTCALPSAAPP